MRKSYIYKLAQGAVIDSSLLNSEKVAIIRELIEREDLELFKEKQEEEKAKAVKAL